MTDEIKSGRGVTRHTWVWVAVGVAAVLASAAFLWFRPDTAFTDTEVAETLAPDVAAAITATTSSTSSTSSGASTSPTSSTETPSVSSSEPSGVDGTETTPNQKPSAQLLARGSWQSIEHETTGSVSIVQTGASRQLVLSDLITDNGPDLKVYLSTKPSDDARSSSYADGAVNLGALKGNRGTQTYELPADLDLGSIRTVSIWCQRFSVGFAVADLVAP